MYFRYFHRCGRHLTILCTIVKRRIISCKKRRFVVVWHLDGFSSAVNLTGENNKQNFMNGQARFLHFLSIRVPSLSISNIFRPSLSIPLHPSVLTLKKNIISSCQQYPTTEVPLFLTQIRASPTKLPTSSEPFQTPASVKTQGRSVVAHCTFLLLSLCPFYLHI